MISSARPKFYIVEIGSIFKCSQGKVPWWSPKIIEPANLQVFSSNLAHLSLLFFWVSGMHFHGAYLSNYDIWLKDPKSITPSSHYVWSLIGQDILNSYTSQYFSGITITSGFYQLWRSEGIITQSQLKYACATCLIATLICLSGSYLHMQLMSKFTSTTKYKSLSQDRLIIIFGSSSISHCAHQIHITLPANTLLDSGICTPPTTRNHTIIYICTTNIDCLQ